MKHGDGTRRACAREKEYTPPPWHPSFLDVSPDPDVTEPKLAMLYTISLGKQGKTLYTIGQEGRVYTIEASDLEKEKGGFPQLWRIFFLPCDYPNFR